MKIARKIMPIVMCLMVTFMLAGCGENESNNHKKNPIATMKVAYENEQGEQKEGTIKLELYANESPETVSNFVNLCNNGFYKDLTKDFMIQGGDPSGNGTGSAKVSDIDKSVEKDSENDYPYTIKGEFKANNVDNGLKFEAGTLAMARGDYSRFGCTEEGYNSGSSQFFIVNTDKASIHQQLQDKYTIFGKVIEGYDVVQEISNIKVTKSDSSSEQSKPEKAPVIKSLEVDTFGEKYKIPSLINSKETMKKLQESYMNLIQQYYQNYAQNQ